MSSKRLFSLMALMVIMSMLLAACGTETPTNTPVPPAATPTTAMMEPTATTAMAEPTATTAMAEPTATTAAATATTAAEETPTVAAGASITGTKTASATLYEANDCGYGGIMKSIEAVDERTIKYTLCNPDPAFPAKLAFSSLGIHSAAHLEETGGAPLEDALGSGPYMVQEWVRGDHLTLVANPNYWGEAPKMKTLVFRWNSEATARLASLRAGEVDGIDNPDTNDFESIQGDTSLNLIPRVALNVFYLGLNNTQPPLDNEAVRQAIAMGIDRQAIVDKFYPQGSAVAQYFTPCTIPGGCEGEPWYTYDLAGAQKMLADAGFAEGFDIQIAYRDVVRGYLPSPGNVAQEIQAQLKALNINATIDVQESGTFLDNASNGNLQMFLLGWGADYPDATNFLDSHFGTGANDSFGEKWEDVTGPLAEAASLSDQEARNALYAEANTAIRTHVPMIPVAHGGSGVVYKAAVTGAHSSPLGNETFRVMEVPGQDAFTWVQNAEPLSLFCADETDGESLRACEQIFDPLLSYKIGSVEVEPNLAEMPVANDDLTEWTVTLREGAMFSDGTPVTSEDVVATFAAQWDIAHPLHKGNTGNFDYWTYLFTAFLNAP